MQGNEPQDRRITELRHAQDLSYNQDWEAAYDIAYKWMKVDPNDGLALNIMAYIMLNTEKCAIGYPLLKYLTTIEPENALAWLNMGMACSDLWRYNEAVRSYKKGIKFATDEKEESMLCVNMASLMVDHGEFADAEQYCHRAIELNDDTKKGRANLGFCQLAQRNWDGWANYRECIDSEWRPIIQYNNEPLWDGVSRGTICIYSEQGLGDEISFGQMLIDMQKWCDENESRLIVDVNPRLEALFKRSFPDMEIHGTRGVRQITWDPREIEYSLPMAQLGEYFRRSDDDFPGTPYMVADPDRVLQWKTLFESKFRTPEKIKSCPKCDGVNIGQQNERDVNCQDCHYVWKERKPVIGIAWRGGIWKTAAKYRQLDLEQLLPVLKSVDAHWVSLQYKPSGKEIEHFRENHPDIDIVEYPFGTLSNDYDDTVAMIAAMDRVVCMQTTVVHVAGSLGVPCWAFVPQSSQWRYGQGQEDFPWADSVRIIRQTEKGQWADVMEKTGEELADITGLPKPATADARKQKDQLRDSRRKVRRNRGANDRLNGSRPSA